MLDPRRRPGLARSYGLTTGIDTLEGRRLFAVAYTALDLGTLGGSDSHAGGLNDNGQVVGDSTAANGYGHPFRTGPNARINAASDLGSLGNASGEGAAYGINAAGQVVGYSSTADGSRDAFRTAAGADITGGSDLGGLGAHNTVAYAINASGQVVGYSTSGVDQKQHAFRTTAAGKVDASSDLGTLGGSSAVAWGVNDAGVAVGFSAVAGDGGGRAFRTATNGKITASGDLGAADGTGSVAYAVNAGGQVAGTYFGGASGGHAFVTGTDGKLAPARALPGSTSGGYAAAFAVNAAGQAVGTYTPNDNVTLRGFVTVDGKITDLNTLVANLDGWVIGDAVGINKSGQIACNATKGGVSHALLLTPGGSALTGTLKGVTFDDKNANGVKDGNDVFVGGKTIYLDGNGNGKPDTGEKSTKSLADGSFSFAGLSAGTYHVRRAFPNGYTYSTQSIDVTLAAGQTVGGLTIGGRAVGSPANTAGLVGYAFDDANKDGKYDAGDTYTGGKRIFLDADNDGVLDPGETSVLTDSTGKFGFANLAAGTYHVRRVFSPGYTYSTAKIDATLTAGQAKTGLLIGTKKA